MYHRDHRAAEEMLKMLQHVFSRTNCAGTFLRGVLEKVGVEPQVKRIGKYKSAGMVHPPQEHTGYMFPFFLCG